jgi:hypothetical protein
MKKDQDPENLEQLLDVIGQAAQEGGRVSWGAVLKVVGRRSFGPLLLVAGLFTLAPVIGDIPGVPAVIGLGVFLIAAQLLFGRDHFWLPQLLLNRSIAKEKLDKSISLLQKPARFIDRLLRRRLTKFTHGAAVYIIAVACIFIAAAMPVMEVVPFSANIAGAALTAFGLALIAHDGLLALLAILFTLVTLAVVGYNFLAG